MMGNCLTFKKSGLRKCSSRIVLFVSMLSALMLKKKEDLAGSALSNTKLPLASLNRPWVQLMPRCSMLNVTAVWAASTVYCAARTGAATAGRRARTQASERQGLSCMRLLLRVEMSVAGDRQDSRAGILTQTDS